MTETAEDIEGRAADFVAEHDLLENVARLGVGLSGGPDSTAMLYVLRALYPDLFIVACHIDHGLQRTSKNAADAAERIALDAGVPVVTVARTCDDSDVAAVGVEAAAREIRYAALEELGGDLSLDTMAIGHTLDDRAETILLNLIRGGGIDGLSSMRPVRDLGAIRLVRPLLAMRRAETRAYCERQEVDVVADPMNTDPAFARTRVREELLPLLESLRSGAIVNIAKAAERLDADRAVLAEIAESAAGDLVEEGPGWVAFDHAGLARLPASIAARVVREALRPRLGQYPPPAEGVRVVLEGRGGSVPGTRLVSRREGQMTVVFDEEPTGDTAGHEPTAVSLSPGPVVEAFGLEIRVEDAPDGDLTLRRLQVGDKAPGATRTLMTALSRAGVPRRLRDGALTLLKDGEPLCAVGPGFTVPKPNGLDIQAHVGRVQRAVSDTG